VPTTIFSNIVAVFVYYVVLLVWNANSLDFSYASTTIFIFIGALSFLSMTGNLKIAKIVSG
jgi:hypothetical protein